MCFHCQVHKQRFECCRNGHIFLWICFISLSVEDIIVSGGDFIFKFTADIFVFNFRWNYGSLILATSCESLISSHSGTLEFTMLIGNSFSGLSLCQKHELITSSCEDSILRFRGSWILSGCVEGTLLFSSNVTVPPMVS